MSRFFRPETTEIPDLFFDRPGSRNNDVAVHDIGEFIFILNSVFIKELSTFERGPVFRPQSTARNLPAASDHNRIR